MQVPILSRLYPHINTYTPCAFNIKQFQSRVPNMISQLHPAFVGYVFIYIYTHVHTYTCIHVYMYTCIYMYIHVYVHTYTYKHIYIYGCVFFSGVQILVRVGSSSSANHTHESYPEPYPESYLRIIPPKITIMNVSFGIVWDCMASLVLMDVTSQLTSVGQIR